MNIIQEITKKYHGKYTEEPMKSTYTKNGIYNFQPQSGTFKVDDVKVKISINETSGAMPQAEPIQIIYYLNHSKCPALQIFPKNNWRKIWSSIFRNGDSEIPKTLQQQFTFSGDKQLIHKLAHNSTIVQGLQNERIYIITSTSKSNKLILTPEFGLENIIQFEKYLNILKAIDQSLSISSTQQVHY